MALIHETLTLEDRLTATMTQCIQVTQRMATALDTVRDVALNVETATAATAVGIDNLSREMRESTAEIARTSSAGRSLTDTLKGLAGGFTAIQAGRWLVNTSDQLVQIDARLQMMTGSAEAAAAAQEQIYQAAMRSRGAYTDMADLVSKLGTLAPDAFGSMGELVGFAEQLQKQMALSGTSTMAAQAAMLQLTQGLASGTLRGEELNSVLEQTPMIAQTIARYMDVDIGTMRELASEGAITADVVKNAMLGAAEETNAAFAQMPMTWGQVWTAAQNIAIQALEPVLGGINFLANNMEIVIPVISGVAAVLGAYAAAMAISNAVTWLGVAANRALLASMVANPFLWVAVAIGIVVANVVKFIQAAGSLEIAWLTAKNTVLTVWEEIQYGAMSVWTGIQNFISEKSAAILMVIQGMVNGAIDAINWMIAQVNKIPGISIGAVERMTFGTEATLRSQAEIAGNNQALADFRAQLDLSQAYRQAQIAMARDNLYQDDTASLTAGAGVPAYDELQSINASVKGIEKAVSVSEEDIKALADVAQRRYINQVNLTSQTPVITINGANTGRTAQDRRALAEAIQRILMEQLASGSVRSTAMTY